jgi:hypothetical protein
MELCLLSVKSPDISHVETLQLLVITIPHFNKILSLKDVVKNNPEIFLIYFVNYKHTVFIDVLYRYHKAHV